MAIPDTITIQRKTQTKSGAGVEVSEAWATIATVEAYIYPLSQAESYRRLGKAVTNLWKAIFNIDDIVFVSTSSEITTKDRIVYGTHTFEITGGVNIGNADLAYDLDLQEIK